MSDFQLLAPAKVNLSLKVTGRRDDGYHNLLSLMVPLTVGDTLRVKVASNAQSDGRRTTAPLGGRKEGPSVSRPSSLVPSVGSLQVNCDNPEIPTDEDSLLAKAFRFAAAHLDFNEALSIELEKRLPIGAGLGGGSSDAAAVIRAVERLTERTLPQSVYPDLAYQVGADVPFFLDVLKCQAAASSIARWVEGIGEVIRPCEIRGELYVLLINPGIHISTQAVYQDLGRQLTSFQGPANVPTSFESFEQVLPFVTNDLESVVIAQYPMIAEIKTRLSDLGADAALMSGSGSTVFGLFSQNKKRDAALECSSAEYPSFWVTGAEVLSA